MKNNLMLVVVLVPCAIIVWGLTVINVLAAVN